MDALRHSHQTAKRRRKKNSNPEKLQKRRMLNKQRIQQKYGVRLGNHMSTTLNIVLEAAATLKQLDSSSSVSSEVGKGWTSSKLSPVSDFKSSANSKDSTYSAQFGML
jgi:hypothetical protein